MEKPFDRAAEDLGNIVGLEHVNLQIPDQLIGTVFYVTGMGLTRDPYLMTGVNNMWINLGRSQFHLITGEPQVLRGTTGIVISDLAALLRRLAMVRPMLEGTLFAFHEGQGTVEVVSPWGNRMRCHAPDPRFGPITLGIPYLELDVAPGTAEGIARFYRSILAAPARVGEDAAGRHTRVSVGHCQELVFRETERPEAPYDGHHIQIYLADFSGPHRRLGELGLVSEESNRYQYRFVDIVDTESGRKLYTLEHEVRSMTHPLYARPLVNRDPVQTNNDYIPGRDAWIWSLPRPG